MKSKKLHWPIIALIVAVAAFSVYNPFTMSYIESIKAQTTAVSQMETDPLYQEIVQKAKEYNSAPQNAKIDSVWKAIPGLNGLAVDINQSLANMRKENVFNEKKLVFKQVPPAVHLSNLPPSPIYKGNPDKPMVTLLVNVAWGNEHLPVLLSTMKKYHVHSTFFLDGSWVKKNPNLAKMILEEGHEIGNHAYTHPDLKKLTNRRIQEELQNTNDVIKATLNVTPKWFAPPSGSYRNDVVTIASELKMNTILWTVDTIDWRNPQPGQMVNRVLSKIHPGAMILMHPTSSSAAGIEALIKGIKAKGLSIGTVSDLLSEEQILPKKR